MGIRFNILWDQSLGLELKDFRTLCLEFFLMIWEQMKHIGLILSPYMIVAISMDLICQCSKRNQQRTRMEWKQRRLAVFQAGLHLGRQVSRRLQSRGPWPAQIQAGYSKSAGLWPTYIQAGSQGRQLSPGLDFTRVSFLYASFLVFMQVSLFLLSLFRSTFDVFSTLYIFSSVRLWRSFFDE